MYRKILLAMILMLTLTITACAAQEAAGAPVDSAPSDEAGLDHLVEALQAAGAQVELGDPIEQAFFSVPGQIVKVNGMDVQVFEYDSAESMGLEASQISEDGSTIGTSMVSWVAAPHFYRSGRLLVLYVGDDPAVLELLEGVLGPPFAGR